MDQYLQNRSKYNILGPKSQLWLTWCETKGFHGVLIHQPVTEMMAPIMAAPAAMHGSMGSMQSNPLVECVKTGQRCERPVLLMGSFDSSAV